MNRSTPQIRNSQKFIVGLSLSLLLATATNSMVAAQEKVPAELETFIGNYVSAYNDRDLDLASSVWAENAEYVDEQAGVRLEGRAEIIAAYKELFKQTDAGTVRIDVVGVRVIADNVLSFEGLSHLERAGETVTSRFLATLVKRGNGWTIDNAREIPAAPIEEQNDELQSLAWMVGEWMEATDSHRVATSVHWSSSRAFLIKSYTAVADGQVDVEGTQIIGWDAKEKRIRSWSFDSDGAFGEESWTQEDGVWISRLTRTLPDGSYATATQTFRQIDADTIEVQLADVVVEDERRDDPQPARMYRANPATQQADGTETPVNQ